MVKRMALLSSTMKIAGATSPTLLMQVPMPMTQDQQPTFKEQDTAHAALRSASARSMPTLLIVGVVLLCAQALIYRIRASVVIYTGIR